MIEALLVDDDKSFLDLAKTYLENENENLEVEVSSSSKKAMKLIEGREYDCIVSDYQMPGLNGLELLKRVREDLCSNIPFIVFTGKGREEVAIDALNLGADRYLQKGGSPKSQFGALAHYISKEVEWHRTEKALKKSEKKYRRLLETTQEAIFVHDMQGEIDFANMGRLEKLGYDEEELEGENVLDFIPDNQKEIIEGHRRDRLKGDKGSYLFEIDIFSKNGKKIPVEISSTPLVENNEIQKILLTVRDITELKSRREKFSTLFDVGPDPAYILDRKGEIEEVNQAFCEKSGYDKDEIIGKTVNELPFLTEETKKMVLEGFRKRMAGEKVPFEMEPPYTVQVETKDGAKRFGQINISVLKKGDKPTGVVGIVRDITEQKELERNLKKTRSRLKRSQKLAKIGSWNIDLETCKLKLSEETYRIFGLPPGKPMDYNKFLKYVHPEDRDYVKEELKKALKKGECEIEHRILIDEEIKWVREKADIKFNEEGDPLEVIGSLQDITKQKKREKKLKEREERLETHLSQTPAVIYTYEVIKGNPETTYVSESVKDVLGHEPEYYTSDPQNFLNDLHPEDKQKLFEKEEKLITEEDTDNITVDYRFKDKKGNYHWLRDEEKILSDEENHKKVIGAWWDITERKRAEERKEFLHSLLRHDVQNKNQVVEGYLELLEEDLGETNDYLKKAKEACQTSQEIIEKIRVLRAVEKEEIEEISLKPFTQEIIKENRARAEENDFELIHNCPTQGCKVKAGQLLNELFSNLIENAIKHSEGSKIIINGKEKEDKIICMVEDNGKGIPDKIKNKIFKKGYQHGETAETGLGLYLVKEIAEEYNGKVEAKDSELGGTRFEVHLQKA
ncbi:MAG: Signal transduction histidine kinase with PAS and PocR sensory domain [Candidatus Methanohalarchaeum thermophilum]|uniref:histidine kinase n=1 Tax=Methanohalarchaeum thermophilum TaxID=1903181 RepID=A0A1Q6DVT1_METT1|nr:MAG: Signal transduction histidine kinase with PAS and PocR sensory domain [Candidatus Methanohalarchaeum thermophilum]